MGEPTELGAFRPFIRYDFYGYADAAPAPDGRPPLMASFASVPAGGSEPGEPGPVWVIVDATGVHVDAAEAGEYWMLPLSPREGGTNAAYEVSLEAARAVVKAARRGDLSRQWLKEAGFQQLM